MKYLSQYESLQKYCFNPFTSDKNITSLQIVDNDIADKLYMRPRQNYVLFSKTSKKYPVWILKKKSFSMARLLS